MNPFLLALRRCTSGTGGVRWDPQADRKVSYGRRVDGLTVGAPSPEVGEGRTESDFDAVGPAGLNEVPSTDTEIELVQVALHRGERTVGKKDRLPDRMVFGGATLGGEESSVDAPDDWPITRQRVGRKGRERRVPERLAATQEGRQEKRSGQTRGIHGSLAIRRGTEAQTRIGEAEVARLSQAATVKWRYRREMQVEQPDG